MIDNQLPHWFERVGTGTLMNSAHPPTSTNSTLSTNSTWKDRKRHTATAEQLLDWQDQYQQHFGWLNQLYFNNELPAYRVSVQDPLIVPGVPAELSRYIAGYCDKKHRHIWLEAFPYPKAEGILLHEMAHVATNTWHGPLFRKEMQRLAALDAPLGPMNMRLYVEGSGAT